jgi:hypothetical protein
MKHRRACFFAVLLLFLGVQAQAAKSESGSWLSPSQDNWPLIPIHASLTPDGRVFSYGTKSDGQQTGYFIYDVWEPSEQLSSGHMTLDNLTQTDLFCSAQVILPQNGRIFIAGGDNWTGTATTNTGNNNTNVFRPSDDTLTRGSNMNRPRWYASTTALLNGEIYIQGGKGGADRPEVRALDGSYRLLSNIDTSSLNWYYPRNFLAPDGRIFGYDVTGTMYYVSTAGSGQYSPAGTFSSSYAGRSSSAAMYRHGRILQFGGNSNGALIVDIRGASPVVTPTQSMSTKRMWVSATLLPDGKVLATGGSEVYNTLEGVNNSAEIWDPATGKWKTGASGSRARLYHSGALLLRDATVLVYGGGAPGPLVNRHAEIYYPPYLFNSIDELRRRPRITSAPSSIDIGTDFSVVSDSTTITRVTLVKVGAVTHSVNMDQRFVELGFSQSSTTSFVKAPDDPLVAPPGYYLLFLINDKGAPSIASIVRINIPDATPRSATITVGGGGGEPFALSCNSREALVGVYGLADGSYVSRVGVQCVPVDSQARWVGNPVRRGATGGSTGSSYTRTCPRDFAVSGFQARASDGIHKLQIECKHLDASGHLIGTGQYLSWVGTSTSGSLQGPYRCASRNPGYAVGGRSSERIDAFNVRCLKVP